MSRDDGFAVMDVSTSWLSDDKFTRLAREYPAHLLWCGLGYAATMSASWRHGKRMKISDSLPAWLVSNPPGVGALMAVRLLDRTGRIPVKTWREWFGTATDRRSKSRAKWTRANDRRRASFEIEHDLPRGDTGVTTATVRPSVPTVRTEGLTGRGSSNGARVLSLADPRR